MIFNSITTTTTTIANFLRRHDNFRRYNIPTQMLNHCLLSHKNDKNPSPEESIFMF